MMYITGTNCNGEYIVLLDRAELNDLIEFRIKYARRMGILEAQVNQELGINEDE